MSGVDRLLARVQADVAQRFFTDRCTIKALTSAKDGRGGYRQEWQARQSDVPCALIPVLARYGMLITDGDWRGPHQDPLDTATTSWDLYLPTSVSVAVGEHVTLSNGETYTVTGEDDASTWRGATHVKVERQGASDGGT